MYSAIYKKKREVAAKSIVHFGVDHTEVAAFLKEIKLMSALRHENILTIIGVLVTKSMKVWLITELMESDLKTSLPALKPLQRVKVAHDIAKGM